MSARFLLQLERDRFEPGDPVSGTILVLEGGGSRSLEALLEYCEETADYREVAISISSGRLHEGDLTTGTSFDFELALPNDALPNHTSRHGELYWQVDAKSDELGRDTHERRRIEVASPGAAPAGADLAPGPPPQAERPSEVDFAPDEDDAEFYDSRGMRWFARGFFVMGVAALIASVVFIVLTARFVAEAEHATGTVVDLSSETDSDGNEIFYPIVRFTTAEGKEIQFVATTGSSPPSNSPGDQVDVLYDPDDPSDAKLSGFFDVWLAPLAFPLLGAAFIAAAWFLRRRVRPTKRTPSLSALRRET